MKFELVAFYEATKEVKSKRGNNCLGSVHLYLIDIGVDIRGIHVSKQGKGMFFQVPAAYGFDKELGKEVRYPVIGFTDDKIYQDMMNFLKTEVFQHIKKVLGMDIPVCEKNRNSV